MDFPNSTFDRLTHYLFRFPAKFHPPVARTLIEKYSDPGERILDPFCGSGTLLVEAAVAGRDAVGIDIDPVAVFVSKVKTHRLKPAHIANSADLLKQNLSAVRRQDEDYQHLIASDISEEEFENAVSGNRLWIPEIPRLHHWFKRYVLVDLAQIHQMINELQVPKTHKNLFRLSFASIIRGVSNADPVPVSGLEVTSYMRHKYRNGRLVNAYALFNKAVDKSIEGIREFSNRSNPSVEISVRRGDALNIRSTIRRPVDTIITSPPYHNAVDYYRRHQLEMFWLGFTKTQEQRLELKHKYVGQYQVKRDNPIFESQYNLRSLGGKWESRIRNHSPKRADAFLHYCLSMQQSFQNFSSVLACGQPMVIIIGNNKWNGAEIPSTELFEEIAHPQFQLHECSWYPIKNRYMSYARRNGASINREYVLAFRRTGQD